MLLLGNVLCLKKLARDFSFFAAAGAIDTSWSAGSDRVHSWVRLTAFIQKRLFLLTNLLFQGINSVSWNASLKRGSTNVAMSKRSLVAESEYLSVSSPKGRALLTWNSSLEPVTFLHHQDTLKRWTGRI